MAGQGKLQVYSGTTLDQLYPKLLELLQDPAYAGLSRRRETIVIQARGVDKWLTYRLARNLGIVANYDFPLFRSFMDRLATRESDRGATPDLPQQQRWKIADWLWHNAGQFPDSLLGQYLKDDQGRGDRAFSLSASLGTTYDDLCYFGSGKNRSSVLLDPVLRKMFDNMEATGSLLAGAHPGAIASNMKPGASLDPGLDRVILFGLSYLPQWSHRLIEAMVAHGTPVHLFLLAPSQYMLAGQNRRSVADKLPDVNPLVAYLGQHAKRQQALIEGWQGVEAQSVIDNDRGSKVLHRIQTSIEKLEPMVGTPSAAPDGSLEFHNCFGPLRQVEALHGRILQLLEESSLCPEDILVMTPDLDQYAPLIRSVFGKGDQRYLEGLQGQKEQYGYPRLQVSIADRSHEEDSWVMAVRDIIKLVSGRFCMSDFMAVLSHTMVQKTCGVEDSEVAGLGQLLSRTGVRWGLDSKHQQKYIDDADGSFGWVKALQRLALSAAGATVQTTMWQQQVPADNPDKDELLVLGKTLPFLLCLRSIAQALGAEGEAKTASGWCEWLEKSLYTLFPAAGEDASASSDSEDSESSTSSYSGPLAVAIRGIRQSSADTDIELTLPLFSGLLEEVMSGHSAGSGFLSGGITFAHFAPIRTIPAKCVVLLGMDEGAFPRRDIDPSFGLLKWNDDPVIEVDYFGLNQLNPPGRQERDQLLFLECILAAQEYLWIFYQGRHPVSQEKQAPCSPVALLQREAQRLVPPVRKGDQDVCQLTVTHPLHPFDKAYFKRRETSKDGQSKTEHLKNLPPQYERIWQGAAAADDGTLKQSRYAFVQPSAGDHTGSLERHKVQYRELSKMLKEPWSWWATNVLNMNLTDAGNSLADDEPVTTDALHKYLIEAALLDAPSDEQRRLLLTPQYWQARDAIPVGKAGVQAFDAIVETLRPLLDELADMPPVTGIDVFPLELVPGVGGGSGTPAASATGISLEGSVRLRTMECEGETRNVLLTSRKKNGKNLLDWWLLHLVLRAAGKECLTVHTTEKNPVQFRPLLPDQSREQEADTAKKHLGTLLSYRADWQSSHPTLLPDAGYEYCKKYNAKKLKELPHKTRQATALIALKNALKIPRSYSEIGDFRKGAMLFAAGVQGDQLFELLNRGKSTILQTTEAIFGPLVKNVDNWDLSGGSEDA